MKHSLFLVLLIILAFGSIRCEEDLGATGKTENRTKNASAGNSTKRIVAFYNFSFNFTTYYADGTEKNEVLIPQGGNTNGSLYMDLVTRGWKLNFNKKKGLAFQIPDAENQASSYLDKIFLDHIGNYEMIDRSTILSMRVLQPQTDRQDIEISQLRDFCWRVDIYPSSDVQGNELGGKLRFCVNSKKDHLLVWKYRYLLETRELAQTNKE